MSGADLVAVVILGSLILYVLLGGADFGGGVWDGLASGPRKKAQRRVIQKAIAPVWEANHVWLILAVVLLFTAFPAVFSLVAIVLHVPLTFLLLGIVLRGAAFVFRQYGPPGETHEWWGRLFDISSAITPVFLGIVIGAVTQGNFPVPERMSGMDYLSWWAGIFPLAIGILTLVIFAFLAAVYLTNETTDRGLQDDFRRRALGSGILLMALLALGGPVPRLVQMVTLVIAAGALVSLYRRAFRWARVLAIMEVVGILLGWGLTQYPFLVSPGLTVHNAAAPESTLKVLLGVLLLGSLLLFPSLYWLMRIFKTRT